MSKDTEKKAGKGVEGIFDTFLNSDKKEKIKEEPKKEKIAKTFYIEEDVDIKVKTISLLYRTKKNKKITEGEILEVAINDLYNKINSEE